MQAQNSSIVNSTLLGLILWCGGSERFKCDSESVNAKAKMEVWPVLWMHPQYVGDLELLFTDRLEYFCVE